MSGDPGGLVGFIRDRLNEDEAAAKLIGVGRRWYVCAPDGCVQEAVGTWDDGSDRLPNHHGYWAPILDPRRLFAEVEAKRRIVDECWDAYQRGGQVTSGAELAETVVRLLAEPHADHPDYRAEWAPDQPAVTE